MNNEKLAEKPIDQIAPEEIKRVVTNAIQHHGKSRDALIPILSAVNDAFGYIPAQAFQEIKKQINLPENAEVYPDKSSANKVFSQAYVSESQLFGLASFYRMLSTLPVGRHVVRFCESAPCHVMGGRLLFQALMDELNIKPGETSPDNRWTLLTTSCLGTCGVGPVIMVDEDTYGNVNPEQLPEILARYE
jgi:NADH-quinone oxidoreductase subunit E